ncbi:hypothetical protein K2173_002953 [Erythroxylum novogranatense]|uniref:Chlorophyll a-b binding protein, chloroplastic n=1 Tax=Erythroxylum novogranatense TaxID=1862640 RepID=A0AAV8TTF2_9ROSI|nr:hypothetical protein K2173_002953 [Erythroxylum novogranatense]
MWLVTVGVPVGLTEVKFTPFQPYAKVFGLQRFRECKIIHGRWAMFGVFGVIVVEALIGIACKTQERYSLYVELVEGSSYLDQPLPFSLTTLIWIELIIIGYIEFP